MMIFSTTNTFSRKTVANDLKKRTEQVTSNQSLMFFVDKFSKEDMMVLLDLEEERDFEKWVDLECRGGWQRLCEWDK